MSNPPSIPNAPASKRTIVGRVPPPESSASMLQPSREALRAEQSASAPTLQAVSSVANTTNPNAATNPGRGRAEDRPTAEDFQASRYKHTHMAGTEGLAEPAADQPRIRLIPGKVVPG